jgi:type II secretory pathway pseudopilin PulG
MLILMHKNQAGFTLVEAAITVLVIGLIANSIGSLLVTTQQLQLQTRYLESATYAAQTEIESLRNMNYSNLVPGGTINFSDELPSDLPNGSTGTVAISEPVDGLRRVDVEITYPILDSSRTVRVSSLIGVLGITQ